jgi:hypothetical protein
MCNFVISTYSAMKIIYNNIIPFKGFAAINLFGVVFARKEYKPFPERMTNHEAIHTAQMKELWYIGFYLLYLIEYAVMIFKYNDTNVAYRNIRFEKEAYANDGDINYLRDRKKFSWKTFF